MKKEFAKECNGNSDIFDSYHEWYTDEGQEDIIGLIREIDYELGSQKVDGMSIEALEEYLETR